MSKITKIKLPSVYIPILWGWLHIHNKEQICLAKSPILVVHWLRAEWMKNLTDSYSKRLLCIGKDAKPSGTLDYHDAWYSRE